MLRLLADDLTGALDSAAEFCGVTGPVRVGWDAAPAAGSLALDSGTREAPRLAALVAVRALAPALRAEGAVAYKKLDSLLRGHPMAELAACLTAGPWRHCVLAPAFPAMGRVTRDALQRRHDGSLIGDLRALCAAEGLAARRGQPGEPLAEGITIFDADDEAALAGIVAAGRAAPGPVLWCGSGGLAGALAAAAPAPCDTRLPGPVLGLFGSDQPVTARQLDACGGFALRVPDGSEASAARIARRMQAHGAALAGFALPAGTPRAAAAAQIAQVLRDLVQALPRPATLIVAGGETLRALCRAAGATALEATGLVARGVPRSRLLGGAWDGVEVVSKSGAFGDDALWRDLLAANGVQMGIATS